MHTLLSAHGDLAERLFALDIYCNASAVAGGDRSVLGAETNEKRPATLFFKRATADFYRAAARGSLSL